MGQNDIMNISEALKEINVGGLTVSKVRGRGKVAAPEIHASKGTKTFVPYFSDKYLLEVIITDTKEEQIIKIIRNNFIIISIFVYSYIIRTRHESIDSAETFDP